MSTTTIRDIEEGDTEMIASAFQAIGWNDPEGKYRSYLKEQEEGRRVVLVADIDGEFAGYGNVIWSSAYVPFQERGIPEVSDLNVLPKFRRKGVATAIMDRAEAMISQRSDHAGIGFGLYAAYGAAQQMYVRRGYVPDGRGITYNWRLASEGQQVRVDDELVLWLVKEMRTGSSS